MQLQSTLLGSLVFIALTFHAATAAAELDVQVNYAEFLEQHDMVWDRVPHRWEVSPYSGNGNVGFLFYQAKDDPKNVISIHTGRHDYYDHRLPYQGKELLWIYRSRLPLGRFRLTSEGDIVGADLRLSLWNAEVTGTITTTRGSYQVQGLSHSTHDILHFNIRAHDGESVAITWHPDEPMPPVRATLDAGGGPKAGGNWDLMRNAPMPMPPAPIWSEEQGLNFCKQILHDHRGETTTAWEVTGQPDGQQTLNATVHHSFPEKNSQDIARQTLAQARELTENQTLLSTHRAWWHDYYPQSFLTLNDPEKEAFYWIQMYKLGSAMRQNGPILDLMGPWYHKTFWPMVWGDLNVQLIYWTHLTANRMSLGESLGNNLDKYADNLAANVPEHWDDSAAVAALFPQDLIAHNGNKVPDMLVWVLHNYWLHCEYAGDRARMRDGVFPLLRRAVNAYRHYLKDNPVASEDGTIHIKKSWSPEYPGGHGQDVNFTIALIRWSCQTLLDINEEHGLNDPLAAEWQHLLDHLVDFQIDDNGLRIGKDIPFEKRHRHYSHLLALYPLAVITPEDPADKAMLRTSLDHWLEVTVNGHEKVGAMPVTGYTATGAASMYATLGDAELAYHYLDMLIKHKNVSTTTMYAEGNPVIESPLSFATSIHDMLLQSWGGKLRVFPAVPALWGDVAFHRFRAQGAFLVSAKKQDGQTQFVTIESEIGSPCMAYVGIDDPRIWIDGVEQTDASRVKRGGDGLYTVDLRAGESVTFARPELAESDLAIDALPAGEHGRNLFGFSARTEALPGHDYYNRPSRR